jgi:dipeptidyl aminopeptidase/acylaminoacyl peptidase
MQPTIFMLALLTVTLGFGLTGPLGERLASAAIAQVSPAQTPAQAQKASQERAGVKITPTPGAIALSNRDDWVYYLAPPGKQPLKLVQGRQAALSPDGKKIAYLKVRKGLGGGEGLMVLDLTTGRTDTLLSLLPERIDGPSWSPGGDLLAFIYNLKEIHLIKADGSGRQKIFSDPWVSPQPPQWAADGKSLFVNDMSDLYQIDLTGRELAKTPLSTFTGKENVVDSGNRFLPHPRDPQLWAFTMAVEGTKKFSKIIAGPNEALFLYDTRTRKRTRLTPPDMLATYPCWSRDGQYLYFSGYREPHYRARDPFRIYRLNRDGTGLTELGKGEKPSQ